MSLPVAPLMLGIRGPVLGADERAFIRRVRPASFILFARNIESPAQVRALTDELAALSPLPYPLIAADQEGGRVQRLKFGGTLPPMAAMGVWYEADPSAAIEATMLVNMLLAAQLREVGCTWMLAPVLDVAHGTTHKIIGDRAFSDNPAVVAKLGAAALAGIAAGGCFPCIKHAPGHGRAVADSHAELPVVSCSRGELAADWVPFKTLAPQSPFMMTAHICYTAFGEGVTTCSPDMLAMMRREFGFGGVMVADDLGMAALQGDYAVRAQRALTAGCDMVITSFSKLQHGMAGTVFDEDNYKAFTEGYHLKVMGGNALATLQELRLPDAPAFRQVAQARVRLRDLWDDGAGRIGYKLEV